ncbi:hypothetical protein [Halocatena halophila]|uniref:hypothetical protein n=1 Tax=Halocatena halophila TaxID=2814576 RepID=UPI002ED01D39
MEFERWEPIYTAICEAFGYDQSADRRARDHLATVCTEFETERLDFRAETVLLVGGGPLAETIALDDAERLAVAGSGLRHVPDETPIDLVVTDLDTDPERVVELTTEGVPVAIAAHGDNQEQLSQYVPSMDQQNVLGTTQARPVDPLCNVGGFTDGDRAAFIVDHCGAGAIEFAGWSFEDPSVAPVKRRKLVWAERLLYWLERDRDEQFSILDGRRGAIEPLPEG